MAQTTIPSYRRLCMNKPNVYPIAAAPANTDPVSEGRPRRNIRLTYKANHLASQLPATLRASCAAIPRRSSPQEDDMPRRRGAAKRAKRGASSPPLQSTGRTDQGTLQEGSTAPGEKSPSPPPPSPPSPQPLPFGPPWYARPTSSHPESGPASSREQEETAAPTHLKRRRDSSPSRMPTVYAPADRSTGPPKREEEEAAAFNPAPTRNMVDLKPLGEDMEKAAAALAALGEFKGGIVGVVSCENVAVEI